jgi:Ca2+:H+ antiporter
MRPSAKWLLVFVPVAIALDRVEGLAPPILFFCAALAIIPLAKFIVHATEQIAARSGDAIGGLLNATFGNAPELIISIVAVRAGLLDLVRASLVGAILANLLLAGGVALLLAGLKTRDLEYNAGAARMYSSMMLLAVMAMVVPAAFSRVFGGEEHVERVRALNSWLALLLLATYGLYLWFSLRTHPHLFKSVTADGGHGHEASWSVGRALGVLLGASVLAAWMSEILVGAAEGTGEALGMSSVFIGLVVVAVVGGAAESLSAIGAARKGRLDLTTGIIFGSCIQIALFVAPMLVLLSRVMGPSELQLSFARAEVGALFLAVLLGAIVLDDGKGNWFKGVQLLVVYTAIASMFYFIPELR